MTSNINIFEVKDLIAKTIRGMDLSEEYKEYLIKDFNDDEDDMAESVKIISELSAKEFDNYLEQSVKTLRLSFNFRYLSVPKEERDAMLDAYIPVFRKVIRAVFDATHVEA